MSAFGPLVVSASERPSVQNWLTSMVPSTSSNPTGIDRPLLSNQRDRFSEAAARAQLEKQRIIFVRQAHD